MTEQLFDFRILLQTGVTLVSVIAAVYVGFVRLVSRFDASQQANDISHGQIVDQLKQQNGYIREHAKELAALRERMSVEESRSKEALRE
jgi:type II secretory pathway component PulM